MIAQREEGDEAFSLGMMLQQLCVVIRSAGARSALRRLALLPLELDVVSQALPPSAALLAADC